jgi:hypothetical protein
MKTTTPFSPYYFAIKSPSNEDYLLLSQYMTTYSAPVKYEAAIELAGYYIKRGEYVKGIDILKESLDRIEKQSFLHILGKMWLYLAYEKINDESASLIYKELEEYKNYNEYKNALKAFCISISEPVISNNKSCLEHYGEKYIKEDTHSTDLKRGNAKTEQTREIINKDKSTPIKIYINKLAGLNIINGALFALYSLDLNFEVTTDSMDIEKRSYKIEKDNNKYLLKNDEIIDFSWDFNKALSIFYQYNQANFNDTVVIIVKDNFRKEANFLRSLFKKSKKIRTIIYTEDSFRDDLTGVYDKYGNNITIINIGKEKDIIEFLPLIRFVFTYKVPIYSVIDCFSGLYLEKYYASYFNYTNVYAFASLLSSENTSFYNNYREFYGVEPDAESLLGYDIVVYIALLNNYRDHLNFLSGIIKIDNNTKLPVRSIKHYFIRKNSIEYYNELPPVP